MTRVVQPARAAARAASHPACPAPTTTTSMYGQARLGVIIWLSIRTPWRVEQGFYTCTGSPNSVLAHLARPLDVHGRMRMKVVIIHALSQVKWYALCVTVM